MQSLENRSNISQDDSELSDEKNKTRLNELTIKKLKTYKGFENITDQQAQESLNVIKTFARVLADIYKQRNK